MRTLSRVATVVSPLAEPLPVVFPSLDRVGIRPRRGAVHMLAATPASGKSLLVAKWVLSMGLPTLFFSADTDSYTTTRRLAAAITGDDQETVGRGLSAGGAAYYSEKLEAADHIRWVFDSDPTYSDLVLEACAFAEMYGEFPTVVVIDNLLNLVGERDGEWDSMRDHTRALKRLTRVTNAAVFICHHMSDGQKDPRFPSPRKEILGKISQLPEMILSLGADLEAGELRVCSVKNRWGAQDPTGDAFTTIYIDPDRVQFYGSRSGMEMGIGAL